MDYDGNWLRFVHCCQRNPKSDLWWQYHVAAMVIEKRPPFRILKLSRQPIMAGHELYVPDCRHWKPKCLLPYGAVPAGDGWDVSVGVNDAGCAILHVTPDQLNL
jgi:hypothetical protein